MMLAKSHRALVIHGNYLDDDEIGFLAAHAENMSVVYCPRTHAYFQHDPYPLAKMIAAGVNVAIGTDSRASNPDLSVLADMRFAAKQHPLVPPATLLRMITVNAAKALGRDDEIGTLTPGKFADLAIMKLPRRDAADPHELLFDPDCCILATIFRGSVVHGQSALASGFAGGCRPRIQVQFTQQNRGNGHVARHKASQPAIRDLRLQNRRAPSASSRSICRSPRRGGPSLARRTRRGLPAN